MRDLIIIESQVFEFDEGVKVFNLFDVVLSGYFR